LELLLIIGGGDVSILRGRREPVKIRQRRLGLVALLPIQIDVEQKLGHRVHLAVELPNLGVTVAVRR